MAKHLVSDDGDLRKYYAAIPHIALEIGLNPYELALYVHFKKAAGDKGGACWKSRATIARESGMSSGMVTKARQALEAPRNELGGRSLIRVTEEPSKSGGKPTCRVTVTDIWAVNMSKCSPSHDDIETETATSPHDVENRAPSPHDERRHPTTIATSPHVPKEEPLKKNPEEEKELSPHSRLMDFLAKRIGHVPNGAKEGKAIKWLLEHGYDPAQCEQCFESLAGERWRTATVTWTTVQANIGAWLVRRNGNGSHQDVRRTTAAERNGNQLSRNLAVVEKLRSESRGDSSEVESRDRTAINR